jgi:hypothetical protein
LSNPHKQQAEYQCDSHRFLLEWNIVPMEETQHRRIFADFFGVLEVDQINPKDSKTLSGLFKIGVLQRVQPPHAGSYRLKAV